MAQPEYFTQHTPDIGSIALREFVKQQIDLIVKRRVEELVAFHMEKIIQSQLETLIETAKDEAVKQLATKLLKLALEQHG